MDSPSNEADTCESSGIDCGNSAKASGTSSPFFLDFLLCRETEMRTSSSVS